MDFTRVSQSIGVVPEEEEKKYASRNIDFSKVTSSLLDAPEEEEEERGLGGDLLHGLFQGADQTTAMLSGTLMLAGGPDASESIAAHYQRKDDPEYVQAYRQLLAKNSTEISQNWAEGNYWKTLGSVGEYIYNATADDKSLTYSILEMLPNSLPTFAGGAAGSLLAAGGAVAAGVAAAPVVVPAFIVGMGIGTILTTIGEKTLDNVPEFGGDLKNPESIRKVFADPEFQEKAAKEGWIKGLEIALVDALSFKLAGRVVSAPGKKLEKALSDELSEFGVDVSSQAAIRKVYADPKLKERFSNHIDEYLKTSFEATDDTIANVRRAADEFAKSQTFSSKARRGVGALGIESVGEGVGEFVGEYHATGEAKPGDALFEAIAGMGQSAITVGAAKSLSGVGTVSKEALKQISRAQVQNVSQGVDSGLDPADINDAQRAFSDVNQQTVGALNERLSGETAPTPNISAYEEVLGDNEVRGNLDQIVEGLLEESGYSEYAGTIQSALNEVYGEEVAVYVPLSPEDESLVTPPDTTTVEQAADVEGDYITVYTEDGKPIRTKVVKESESGAQTVLDEDGSSVVLDKSRLKSKNPKEPDEIPATKSRLTGYAVGSVDKTGVDERPGTTVVRITVPVSDVVSRGNAAKGQLVVRVENLKQAELAPKPAPAKKPENTVLATAKKREAQITQEEQLDEYEAEFDAGAREVEVEASKKTDPAKTKRAAVRENAEKLSRLPEPEALVEGRYTKTEDGKRVTALSLAQSIKRNKVPTEKGRGEVAGTIDTRKRDIREYRNALEKPDQIEAVNKVLKKRGAKLVRKNKELILTDNSGKTFGLGTVRVQDYTIDQYLDLAEDQKLEVSAEAKQLKDRQRERKGLAQVVTKEQKRKMPVGRVATNVQVIEDKFVTRKGGVTRIDESGLEQYLERVKDSGEWKKSELNALDREVKRIRTEAEISETSKESRKARTQIVTGTKPSKLAPGMGRVARLKGRTLTKFHASATNLLRKGTTDSLLGKIAGAYTKNKKVGAISGEKVTPANILTLPPKADTDVVARVYSLASMLIYGQDSVTYSRPDSSLNLDADSTSLGGHLKSSKNLNASQFAKLSKEVERVVGPDSKVIRISDFEFVIHNDSLNKSQLARRLGRLQAKFGQTYAFETEFFVSTTETLTHNWAEDSSGEGIRNQIRELGFTDLLEFIDNRRDAFLELAQRYGANIEETKQQGIEFAQPPATGPPARKIRASLKAKYKQLQFNDYESLPQEIKDVVDNRISRLDDPDRARQALIDNAGTPWAAQAIEGAIAREALDILVSGQTPTFPSIFDRQETAKLRKAIESKGAEAVWTYLEAKSLIGHAAKPVNSVNSSFINCEPSEACAKFCYATKGNYQYVNTIIKGELSDWAVTTDPKKSAKMVARQYGAMPEFLLDKALRVFDKGDGNSSWVKFIEELNKTKIGGVPIRVQVFSKHPEFLRQIPEMNVRLLSIDETNVELADQNPDLGVSYVYTGTDQDNAWIAKNQARFKEHGGVILPVKLGQKLLGEEEINVLPKWSRPWICPIDKGVKKVGVGPGEWNCTKCDIKGGIGCFHGQATKTILDTISEAREIPYAEQIQKNIEEIRAITGQLDAGERGQLLAQLDALIDIARGSTDTATEIDSSETFTNAVDEDARGREETGGFVDPVVLNLTEVEIAFIRDFGVADWKELHEVAPSTSVRVDDKTEGTTGVLEVNPDELSALADHLESYAVYADSPGTIPPRFRNSSWIKRAIYPPDVKASLPIRKPADGGFFLGRARTELNKRWGQKNIENLERDGVLKIVSNVTELPADLQDFYETHEGIHDQETGLSYLIAENIREGQASEVLMHEVGVHFGLKRMLGSRPFFNLLTEILNRKNTEELKPYFDEVSDAYSEVIKSGEMSEYDVDFLEEVLAKIAQDPKASNMGIVEELYRRVKVWLTEYLPDTRINIKPADIQALTRGALKKSMKGQFRAESLKGTRVMASMSDRDPKFLDLVMNILRRPDVGLRDFPVRPIKKVSNRHKEAEFSHPNAEDHINKKAKKKVFEATKEIESVFRDLNQDNSLDIDFALDDPAFANSERVVRVRDRKSGTMLAFRFGFEPIDQIKGLMLGPVIDFHNMGVMGHKDEYTMSQMRKDFRKAITLLKKGKLKNQHSLSAWANYRMGPRPPANYFIRHLKEGQTWNDFINQEELNDKQTVARIVMTEDVAIENGFLPDGPVTPVKNKFGRYRYSLPSQSTNDLTAEDKVVMHKATGKSAPTNIFETISEIRQNKSLWFGQGIADRYLSIKNSLGDDGLRAWKMMHLSDNATGLMHAVLHFGRPKEETRNGEFDGYSLHENSKGLLEILGGLEGETDRFLSWMVGHRADKLMKEGRENFYTKEDIARLKKFGKGKTITGQSRTLLYAQTMKEISKFQGEILDLATKAGVISKKDRQDLMTEFYLPFYREFEKDGQTRVRGPAMTNNDVVNLRDVIQELKGSELKTHDVLHNLMMNWHSLLNASMKNRAGVAAVEAAEKAGVARLLDKKEAEQMRFAKTKSKSDKYNHNVYVMRDGKREYYEINDHFVLESLLQLNWQGPSGAFSRYMSDFKRMLTIGVTASPAFKIRNLIRDSVHSVAVSDLNYNIFGNVKEGISRAGINDPVYQRLIASGGAFNFGFLHDDPSAVRRILKYANKGLPRNDQELKDRVIDTPGKALNFLRKGWDKYGEIGNRLENANRMALYLQRVDEIGHLEASFEARDLLNFSAHGSFPVVQHLVNGIAFLNARLAGAHKLIRSGTEKEKRAKFLKVVGTVTLASIAYELGMEDDEDYRNLPDYIKETYWPVKLPGDKSWFLIPKPFEIGAIASIGQRMTEMFINESVSPKFFATRVRDILMDQLAFDWRLQGFKPVIEVATNYDSFRDQQIENEGWRVSGKLKHKRYRKNTSEIAKLASSLLDEYQPGETVLSPVQIDHLIRGYFGWLGMTIAGWGDIVLTDGAPEPTARMDESSPGMQNLFGLAPISSFYKQAPMKADRYVNLFWEQYKDMQTLYQEYKGFVESDGAEEEYAEWLAESGNTFKWRSSYEDMRRQMGDIGNMITDVYESMNMTPDEKRAKIDELIELRNKSAKDLVKMRQEYERSLERSSIPGISDAEAEASVFEEDEDYDPLAIQAALQRGMEKRKTLPDRLYQAINAAEFRGLSKFRDAFIRTRHSPKGGSTAYGPLQITTGLMRSARDQLSLTKPESRYVDRFIEQGEKFIKYGNEPDRTGYEEKYDYGGEGDLTSRADRRLYEQVGKKLISLIWKQSDEDMRKFLSAWRFGGSKDVEKADKKYFVAFTRSFDD